MTIQTTRFIAEHPRPFMETHFPQFQIYPSVQQNIPRPTWKGRRDLGWLMLSNGCFDCGSMRPGSQGGVGGLVDDLLYPSVTGVPTEAVVTATNRGMLFGGAVALAIGVGATYFFMKRKRK